MKSKYPERVPRGIPHAQALERGVCGAQRKDEQGPCLGLRDRHGRSTCGVHCGAKNRVAEGYPCGNHPRESGRCNYHGDKTPVGVDSPHWRNGSRSRLTAVLSGDNAVSFEQALSDPAWLEMREEMAYLRTAFYDAAERAQLGVTADLWDELGKQADLFSGAGKPEAQADALRRIVELIRSGVDRTEAQREVLELVERRRKVAESERRRVTDEQMSISSARALAFAGRVFAVMREALSRHIGGTEEEAAIVADVRAGLQDAVGSHVGRGAGHVRGPEQEAEI